MRKWKNTQLYFANFLFKSRLNRTQCNCQMTQRWHLWYYFSSCSLQLSPSLVRPPSYQHEGLYCLRHSSLLSLFPLLLSTFWFECCQHFRNRLTFSREGREDVDEEKGKEGDRDRVKAIDWRKHNCCQFDIVNQLVRWWYFVYYKKTIRPAVNLSTSWLTLSRQRPLSTQIQNISKNKSESSTSISLTSPPFISRVFSKVLWVWTAVANVIGENQPGFPGRSHSVLCNQG